MTAVKSIILALSVVVLAGCKEKDSVPGCAFNRGDLVRLSPENSIVVVALIRSWNGGCEYVVRSRETGAMNRVPESNLSALE